MNKSTILYLVTLAYFILICELPIVFDIHPIVILIGGIVLYFLGIFTIEHFIHRIRSEEKLEQKIIKKLRSEGYKCEKDEGELTYRMNGRTYRVHFWQSRNDEFRIIILDYTDIDEDWEKISMEGQAVLANAVNIENPHITLIAQSNRVVCAFISSVSSAEDFMVEIKRAYRAIGEALNYAYDILPQIKYYYPAKEKEVSIGFAKNNNSNDSSNIFNQQS